MQTIYNLHNFVAPLPPHVVKQWQQLSVTKTVDDQHCIYRQGVQATEVYQILSGEVRLCNYSEDGKELVFGQFKAGDCFGEVALIDGLPRACHAIASGQTTIGILSKKNFHMLYDKYPEISKQLNLMLVHRLRLLWQYSEDACTLNLHQRIARVLLRLRHSHGEVGADGIYWISTSHEEIGRMLGASRQSVSKELKQLEVEGLINVQYGKIFVLDPNALHETYESLVGQDQITPIYNPSS